jgi:two-component system sensor histidine kinase UhpB
MSQQSFGAWGWSRAFPTTAARQWKTRALGLSLFYKVLIANAAIVMLGAIGGTWLTLQLARDGQDRPALVVILAAVGVSISLAVNHLVLRAALQPVEALRQTADAVRAGNLEVRAAPVLFPDPALDRFRNTFNEMLDDLQRKRDQLRSHSSLVLIAQEEERKRIARDLHDGVAQDLTALLLRVSTLRGINETDAVALRQLVAETFDEVRRLARELRPSVLDDLGLPAALAAHVDDLRSTTRLDIQLSSPCQQCRLPREVEVAFYRIAQEALTNVLKHASAAHVRIAFDCSGPQARLSVTDDGRGFDPELARTSGHPGLGLFGMEERAALVDGHLTIDSAPGRGTTVAVIVPLPS